MVSRWGGGLTGRLGCRWASRGLTAPFSGRLLQSYLKGLERMEEEPEHMSREQGEGLGEGAVDGRRRAARAGTDPRPPPGLLLPPGL